MGTNDAKWANQPIWLAAACAGYHPPAVPTAHGGPPSPGEIWWAQGDAGVRRLVYVVERFDAAPEGISVQVALVTPEVELSSDQNLRYAAVETGLPFDVLLEADLVGSVLREALTRFAGRVPDAPDILARAAGWGEFAPTLAARRGLPYHGPHDTRLAPVDAELTDLYALSGSWNAAFWALEAAGAEV